jgi:hypothetical protein
MFMRAIPVLALVGLLLLPGCSYFDEYTEDTDSQETVNAEIELIQGCTDSEANNYDENAEEDDGSWVYGFGC